MADWTTELPGEAAEGKDGHPEDHNKIVAAIREARTVVDGVEAEASTAPAWGDVTGRPSTFAPADHDHAIGDVTGLQDALDGKQKSGNYATTAQVNAKADQTALDALEARLAAAESDIAALKAPEA